MSIHFPKLIMLVGLPASGKSTFARSMVEHNGFSKEKFVHVSSDEIRKEFPGMDNGGVFQMMYKRTKANLLKGVNVIYDATNLSMKYRVAFLESIRKIPCERICLVFAIAVDECKRRNALRPEGEQVPDEVYDKMLSSFRCPMYFEGWDEIRVAARTIDENIPTIDTLKSFNQKNSHHTLSLGEHELLTASMLNDDPRLYEAALFHDLGKYYTRVYGEDGEAQYHGHEGYGAYYYLTLDRKAHRLPKRFANSDDELYISALISHHMRLYMDLSNKKREREKKLFGTGNRFYVDLLRLHEADELAH